MGFCFERVDVVVVIFVVDVVVVDVVVIVAVVIIVVDVVVVVVAHSQPFPMNSIVLNKIMTQSQLVCSFQSQGVSKILRACRNFGKVNG